MDIYSAETIIKKLLVYVEDLADNQSKHRMYSKSKDRLKEIATTCNQVVAIISTILEDEVLQDDSIEFGQRSDLNLMLADMQNQIDHIKRFTENDVRPTSVATSETTYVITPAARKNALKQYSQVLSKLSNASTDYVFADRCSKLLWAWFDVRFHQTITADSSFRYSMKKFPEWIQAIVILYGNAIQSNTVGVFEDTFQLWLHTLLTTDARDRYAVPYEIYQFCKNPDPSNITLDAVILWDILLDLGLRDLCTSNKADLYLNEYGIYDLCNSLKPEVLDNYVNYSIHPEIFVKLGWEGAAGGSE